MSKPVASSPKPVRPAADPEAPAPAPAGAPARSARRLRPEELWALLGTLGLVVAVNVPQLGSDPWPFRPGSVEPTGVLAPLVRAAGREWDVDVVRAPALLAGLLVALASLASWRLRSWSPRAALALAVAVLALVLAPAVLLQAGLRHATAPWFHTNDSTYQIELAGDLVLDGDDPYGHDYRFSGLERFYTLDGSVREETRARQVALRHFAYFPGTTLTAAAWRALPSPLEDYRFFVLLTTIASLFAALAFKGPFVWRLAIGSAFAASPLLVRAAWFGTADAPSLLFVLLGFALLSRSRYAAAAVSLAVAVLLKQFALVAVPFFAVMLLQRRVGRPVLVRAAAAFAAVLVAGFAPFALADARALWDDTVAYGAGTYRIIGYGLSGLLLRAGILEDREGPYPFALLALLVWLPVTLWLLWNQLRTATLWLGGAGFAVSMFLLLFIGRVFQNSYLVWPLAGVAVAALLWAGERAASPARSPGETRPEAT